MILEDFLGGGIYPNEPVIFESSGSFTPSESGEYFILVVGGGGSGGGFDNNPEYFAGGGGSGMVSSSTMTLDSGVSYTVTIGAGGAGVTTSSNTSIAGNDGSPSSFDGLITASGGGGGASGGTNPLLATGGIGFRNGGSCAGTTSVGTSENGEDFDPTFSGYLSLYLNLIPRTGGSHYLILGGRGTGGGGGASLISNGNSTEYASGSNANALTTINGGDGFVVIQYLGK